MTLEEVLAKAEEIVRSHIASLLKHELHQK
jgi:hypothetical protein